MSETEQIFVTLKAQPIVGQLPDGKYGIIGQGGPLGYAALENHFECSLLVDNAV